MKKAFLPIFALNVFMVIFTGCSKDVKQPPVKKVNIATTKTDTKTTTSSTNQNTNTQTQTGHTCGSHNAGQYHGSNDTGY